MAKVYLLLQDWPARDRKCWATAIAEGDVLDGRGPASHWAPATKHINIHHYGRWLGYLATTNQLETGQKPDARVTPAAVRSYVKHLQASIAPVTVVSTLVGLKVMMKALAPDQEWRWLADFCNRLNRNAEPSRDKRSRMLPLGRIYGTAIEKLETLSKTDLTRRVQIVGFRNALMLALLAVCVLRVKNFASLQIGKSFIRAESGWRIQVPAKEVKNKQPMDFYVPERLVPFIESYLTQVRPRIDKEHSDYLWLTWGGKRFRGMMVWTAITRITRELFGKEINPHLLRDCAATTLATESLNAAMAARGLLGHRHIKTTEKYYVHAQQLQASRKVNCALQAALRLAPLNRQA